MHDTIAEGDTLHISEPRNHFPLANDAPFYLLLAGGIGITPLLAMAEHLSRQGQPFMLHHAARSRACTPFVESIGASAYAAQVSHHFGDGSPGERRDIAQTLRQAPEGSHLYVCGPQRFIDAALDAARLLGWSQDRLRYEYFSAAPVDTTADGSFELEIASTGQLIRVRADQTPLQALLDAGIDMPSSCEQGCGTCLTGVKSGTPLHQQHPAGARSVTPVSPCGQPSCSATTSHWPDNTRRLRALHQQTRRVRNLPMPRHRGAPTPATETRHVP